MTALLLTACPIAAALIALWVAHALAPRERWLLAGAAVVLALSAALSPNSYVHDHYAHFRNARLAWSAPIHLLETWDRPAFLVLYAGPARLGLLVARCFSIVPATVAIGATMLAARALGLSRPWLAGLLVFAQYDFFGEASSTMTELLFAAGFAVACWGVFANRLWLAAAGLAFAVVSRPEAPLLVAGCSLAAFVPRRRLGPIVVAFLPLAAYVLVGGAIHHDPLWYVHQNAYADDGVALRLEARQLWQSFFYDALVESQPLPLVVLEIVGAAFALRDRARGWFLLVPVAIFWALLTFVRIGDHDWWRQSRYLVAIAPALALLAALAERELSARVPRLAPAALLVVTGLGAGITLVKNWRPWPQHGPVAPLVIIAAFVAIAALAWVQRRRVPLVAAFATLLVVPLVLSPPGSFNRHRPTPWERASAEVVRWLAPRTPATPAAGTPGAIGSDLPGIEPACAEQLGDPCPLPLRLAAEPGPGEALFVKSFGEHVTPTAPPEGWREAWRRSGVRVHGAVLFPVIDRSTVVVWERL